MQILLGILIAAVVGVAVHFVVPGRDARGIVVAPMLATAVGAVAWTVFTWLGVGIDNPWIWVSAIVAPAIVTAPVVFAFSAARRRRDDVERARLRIT